MKRDNGALYKLVQLILLCKPSSPSSLYSFEKLIDWPVSHAAAAVPEEEDAAAEEEEPERELIQFIKVV